MTYGTKTPIPDARCHCGKKPTHVYWCLCGICYGACNGEHGIKASRDNKAHFLKTYHDSNEYYGANPYAYPDLKNVFHPSIVSRKGELGQRAAVVMEAIKPTLKTIDANPYTNLEDKYRWQAFCLLWSAIGWAECAKDGYRWCSSCEKWNDNYPKLCWCSPGWDD